MTRLHNQHTYDTNDNTNNNDSDISNCDISNCTIATSQIINCVHANNTCVQQAPPT